MREAILAVSFGSTVDQARSRDGSFGLGLSIAQRITEEHHGRIWAESGGGCNRFIVELPIR